MNQSPHTKPRLLFLYSELADYFLACIRKLLSDYDVEVEVIHWPVNKEAPFVFSFTEKAKYYEKSKFSKKELQEKIKSFAPDFIYCSGWMDKDYLEAVKGYKSKIPVVMGLDTWWTGSFKQQIACLLSRFTLMRTFSHAWVPGSRQKKYALKLGFKEKKILTGYYTADTDNFKVIGDSCMVEKSKKFPHRLIYAGRYYDFKGITDLWDAFISWKAETNNDWELWCLGTGEIKPIEHPAIKHFGFVQPKEMGPYMLAAGVFVMPSRFEPWGVVLHEFCTAGFPAICSDKVGAAEAFINEGENGYIYPAGNVDELKELIKKITASTDDKLLKMAEKSREKSLTLSPAIWAKTLMNTLQS